MLIFNYVLTPLIPLAPAKQKKRHAIPPLDHFSPVKASPPTSSLSPIGFPKENSDTTANFVFLDNVSSRAAGRNLLTGAPHPLSAMSQNLSPAVRIRRGGVFKDSTDLDNRGVGRPVMNTKERPKPVPKAKQKETDARRTEQDSVRKRVNEWERERERLREMEGLETFRNELDEEGDISFATISSTEKEQDIRVARVAVRATPHIVPAAQSVLGMVSRWPYLRTD